MNLEELTFLHTPATIGISIAVAVILAVLCLLAWRKSGFAPRTGLIETLRFVLVVAILLTLNQPEWVEEFEPEDRPTVAVLYDGSSSMRTRDVITDDPQKPETRAAWVAPRVASERWAPEQFGVTNPLEVAIEPFSMPVDGSDPLSIGTNLADPLTRALENHSNLRAVVLISDGDYNVGKSPLAVATRYRTKKIPIFTVPVGSVTALPDVELAAFDAPTFTIARKSAQVPFSIKSSLTRDTRTTVELITDSGQVISKEVTLPAKGTLDDVIEWTPVKPGPVELTLRVPVEPVESREDNNELTARVDVREESLQVLLIESRPRWEYRYLRNALVRDPGVDVSCLLFHPEIEGVGGGPHYLKEFPAAADLSKFDVVFLGDVGADELGIEEARLLKGLVQGQASGLIFMPGFRGKHLELVDTPLGELIPIHLDAAQPKGVGSALPATLVLTEQGRGSLLTKFLSEPDENARLWRSLPGFQWHAPVLRAKAGSTTLAVHERDENEYGRIPLLVTRSAGTGKVLFMGTDGAWRWREGVEDKYHYRFWGQVIRWMAYQRNMADGKTLRLFYSPERPEVDDRVTVNVNAMDRTGEPVQQGTVSIRVESPTGQVQKVRLASESEEWGLYGGHVRFSEPGAHRVTVLCRETGEELEAVIEVRGGERESIGDPARPEILAEIAKVSRGEVIRGETFDAVFDHIRALPEPAASERRIQLWANPYWAGVILFLLALFWVGRKWNGTI